MNVGHGFVNNFLYGFAVVQFRFLGQVTYIDAWLRPGFANVILIYARHNA